MRFVLKWRKAVIIALLSLIAAQLSASALVRFHAVHSYLQSALERAFGRPVEVRRFNVALLPRPALDADEITVGEDPEFGNEYFLRAERLTAGLRWRGLLRGQFEFGTLSLNHASLILVRNREGSWNMERWLPPASSTLGLGARFYGPQKQRSPSSYLKQIDVNDGRINFKLLDEKAPFAFVGVSGKVSQKSAGRWHLELDAQPWSSGVPLQSAGTLLVRGDVAGTSARLQPAEIQVHWEKASLADLFRLLRGQDYGVRGIFSVDATIKSDASNHLPGYLTGGDWKFTMQARAAEIHRWDLSERADDPSVNITAVGRWNTFAHNLVAERFSLETARSNLRGSARFDSLAAPSWEVRVDSAGVQAADLLAWYRAFDSGVSKVAEADAFLTGGLSFRGWPFELTEAAFSTGGGQLRVAGADSPVRIGPFQGGRTRDSFNLGPVRLSFDLSNVTKTDEPHEPLRPNARRAAEPQSALNVSLRHDVKENAGTLKVEGHLERTENLLKFLTALGRPMNPGWELSGSSELAVNCRWEPGRPLGWNGHIDFEDDSLQVAGLNKPLEVHKARLELSDTQRVLRISAVDGFGSSWSGQAMQPIPASSAAPPSWNFQLHADRLDAADIDLWVNPKGRPGWLERLLPSLLVSNPNSPAGEMLRRINADGELRIDDFVLDNVHFTQLRALGGLHDLHLEIKQWDARWAAGKVHARILASFTPHPVYEANADLDDVELKQLPWPDNLAARFAGRASATLHLNLQGIGRAELLESLTGKGQVKVRDLEFQGWDANATIAGGEPQEGASHWSAAEGVFQLRGPSVAFPALRLTAGPDLTVLKGIFAISKDSNFTIEPVLDEQVAAENAGAGYVLKVSGPADIPRISIERLVARRRVQ